MTVAQALLQQLAKSPGELSFLVWCKSEFGWTDLEAMVALRTMEASGMAWRSNSGWRLTAQGANYAAQLL